MKISASSISMESERNYQKSSYSISSSKTATIMGSGRLLGSNGNGTNVKGNNGAVITISEEARKKIRLLQEEEREKRFEENNSQGSVAQLGVSSSQSPKIQSKDEAVISMIKKMIEMMKALREGRRLDLSKLSMSESTSSSLSLDFSQSSSMIGVVGVGSSGSSLGSGMSGVWARQTVSSEFVAEEENTAFTSQGLVKTADGREITFGISVEMSRSYVEQNDYLKEEVGYVFTDPLVINMDADVASVSDQKFYFDLDADGKEEQISFAGEGSGFLALDKNSDGTINDGNELFGTRSGDGFKDLSAYDKDKNGWIDENDEIFNQLKIWTKDEDGKDQLVDLKKAGVGALYLGKVSTEFSLNSQEDNKTNAVIRSTGMYLKENGEAGTLQHVDLAV